MKPILLAATLCAIASAQDAVPYASLADRLAPFGATIKDRAITVVTTDGQKHKGEELRLGADGLRLFAPKSAGAFYPKERIARIEIAPGPRRFRKIRSNAKDIAKITGKVCGYRGETSRSPEPIECVIAGPITAGLTTARAGVNAPFYFLGGVADVLKRPDAYVIAP